MKFLDFKSLLPTLMCTSFLVSLALFYIDVKGRIIFEVLRI